MGKVVCADSGKIRYAHPNAAARALRRIRENPKTEKIPQRSYGPCKFCSGWHLTSIAVEDRPPREFKAKPHRRRRKRW